MIGECLLKSSAEDTQTLNGRVEGCWGALRTLNDEWEWVARDPSSLDLTGTFIPQRMLIASGLVLKCIQVRLGDAQWASLSTPLIVTAW